MTKNTTPLYIVPPAPLLAEFAQLVASLKADQALPDHETGQRILAHSLGLKQINNPGFDRPARQRHKRLFKEYERRAVKLRRSCMDNFIEVMEVYAGVSTKTGDARTKLETLILAKQDGLDDDFRLPLLAGEPQGDGKDVTKARATYVQAFFLICNHLASDAARRAHETMFGEKPIAVGVGALGGNGDFAIDLREKPATIGLSSAHSLICGAIDVSLAKVLDFPVEYIWGTEASLGLHTPGGKVVRMGKITPGPGDTTH